MRLKFWKKPTKWHKWEYIPMTPIKYLNEEEWTKFVEWTHKKAEDEKWDVNWFFWFKIKYMLRGWYGHYSPDTEGEGIATIFIREKYYNPTILHHEMGHIIQRQHKWWSPGIMNPTWIFRWFN